MGHFGQLSAQQIDQRAVRAEAEQLLAGWKKKSRSTTFLLLSLECGECSIVCIFSAIRWKKTQTHKREREKRRESTFAPSSFLFLFFFSSS